MTAVDGWHQVRTVRDAPVGPVVRVAIAALVLGGSPRQEPRQPVRVRAMAAAPELPPILVHRPSMWVIDGGHRVEACRLRGDQQIEARFFDGSAEEAFLLAVRANLANGLPLSLADREAAAARVVLSHQEWSDRTIATAVGLSPKTVATVRRRSTAEISQLNARIGRDGRIRPLSAEAGRLRASRLFAADPSASVRDVARAAGISVGTAHDVLTRLAAGREPVPRTRSGRPAAAPTDVGSDGHLTMLSRYRALRSDPSLRYTERGRDLIRWLRQHLVQPDDWRAAVDAVPPHCAPAVADLAAGCAAQWQQIADELNRRALPATGPAGPGSA